jgi:putative transcriptional regulator
MSLAPKHHPAEDTLLRHAAGMLPSGRSLVIATHLPFCANCQAAIRLGEAIGGALLAALPVAEPTPDLLNRTLARLDTPASHAVPADDPMRLAPDVPLPDALRGLVRPKWRWLAPGISRIAVNVPHNTEPREHVYLLRVAPGTSLPDHGHRGWEATCVLAGSFTDASGEYGPGDVAETDVGVMHRPVAGSGEACICLIGWEGNLRMSGLLARLAQPFLGV